MITHRQYVFTVRILHSEHIYYQVLIGVVQSSNKVTVSFILEYNILWMCERFWMVFEMLFLYSCCCVSSTFFKRSTVVLLFDMLCSNTSFICFKLCDMNSCIFGYMLRSCHHAHVVDSKMLLYINSNVSWGFDYIHKYFKIWNVQVGIKHML